MSRRSLENEQLLEADDQVVVAVVVTRLRAKGADAELAVRNGHVWTIRDGAVLSLRGFPNPDDALKAASVRE